MSELPIGPELFNESIDREAAATSWAEAARLVSERTGDEEAQRLYAEYLGECGIGQYEDQGLKWIAGSRQPKLVLVPIFEREHIIRQDVAQFQGGDGLMIAAYYKDRPGRILFSGATRMTPEWKGIVLLHEAAHADSDYGGKYSEDEQDSHWKEEVDVFRMEHRWMQALGGDGYSQFVSEEVVRFLSAYDDNEGKGGSIPKLAMGSQLDQAFGPASSEREAAVRHTATWFDVSYRMFEEKYGAEQGYRDMVGLTKGYYTSRKT